MYRLILDIEEFNYLQRLMNAILEQDVEETYIIETIKEKLDAADRNNGYYDASDY